jgi:hypothetical protein
VGSVAKSTFWGRSRKWGAEKSETYRTQKHRFWFFATEPLIVLSSGEDLGQRAFARTVRTHDDVDLAGVHREVDALQDFVVRDLRM